jgi:hypothetical protein
VQITLGVVVVEQHREIRQEPQHRRSMSKFATDLKNAKEPISFRRGHKSGTPTRQKWNTDEIKVEHRAYEVSELCSAKRLRSFALA